MTRRPNAFHAPHFHVRLESS